MSRKKKTGNAIAPGQPWIPASSGPAIKASEVLISKPMASNIRSTDPHAIWQQAHDALQAALELGTHSLDQTKDKQQRDLLNTLLDALSAELTALNQEDMESHTISLQAASQQLDTGLADLKSLRQEIDQVSSAIANAAKVVTAVDEVLSGIQAFLATFPAL